MEREEGLRARPGGGPPRRTCSSAVQSWPPRRGAAPVGHPPCSRPGHGARPQGPAVADPAAYSSLLPPRSRGPPPAREVQTAPPPSASSSRRARRRRPLPQARVAPTPPPSDSSSRRACRRRPLLGPLGLCSGRAPRRRRPLLAAAAAGFAPAGSRGAPPAAGSRGAGEEHRRSPPYSPREAQPSAAAPRLCRLPRGGE
ncbi:unnamed protein product [Urochloa humidicola]